MTTEEKKTEQSQTPDRRKRSVTVYLTILFAVAFLLLLLAYFMQQRSSETMIDTLKSSASNAELLNELIDENRALRSENDALSTQAESLQQELAGAQAQLETLNKDLKWLDIQYNNLSVEHESLSWLYSCIDTLYYAETMAAEGDYAQAAARLLDWDQQTLLEYLEFYDRCITDSSSPNCCAFPLQPRYDALVTTLVAEEALIQTEDGTLALPDEK